MEGSLQGKVWGTSKCLFARNNTEVHIIHAKKGGFSSRHLHSYKWNRFYVLSGKLRVTCFRPSGLIDITDIGPGEMTDVAPGQDHKFDALEDTMALEIYFVTLEHPDIERKDNGGISEAPAT